jgi:hypothetical protein
MALDSKYINASGQPRYADRIDENIREAEWADQHITFPSGVFGAQVVAHLSSFNATFGFNKSPHRFELEYIPDDFSTSALPVIGTLVSLTIGDNFFLKGEVKHVDYRKSVRGKILNVSIEDIREDLNEYYVDTYGVLGKSDVKTEIDGIADVRYWYINYYDPASFQGSAGVRELKDLQMFDQHGASYRQIYEAVEDFLGTDVRDMIPEPEVIESQLSGDVTAYKWQFRMTPLLDAVAKILNDVAFDFYWNMSEGRIVVINRKQSVNINENDIPISGDQAETIDIRYGHDEGEIDTKAQMLGGKMEGIIGNTQKFGTIEGAFTLDQAIYDLGLGQVGAGLRFTPGWKNANLRYFDANGNVQIYAPSDLELAMSLKSVEHWCWAKGLSNRISSATLDSGQTTISQFTFAESGIGMMPNRRSSEGWVMDWYNRVRTFAQNHFGRTYVLENSNVLVSRLDEIGIVDAAWCNLENQTRGNFIDGYKITDTYNMLAPFWDSQTNKLRPFAEIDKSRFQTNSLKAALYGGKLTSLRWGVDGEQEPARFGEYNEDKDLMYVPLEAWSWTEQENKFSENFLSAIDGEPRGIAIRFPQIVWKEENNELNFAGFGTAAAGLGGMRHQFTSRFTTGDFQNPFRYIQPINLIGSTQAIKVCIPIQVDRRYGYAWPSKWATGTGNMLKAMVDDRLVPWSYEPRGSKVSYTLMDDDANATLQSLVVDRTTVTFAELTKVGLPAITFDNYANQNQTIGGYGVVNHGITNLSVSKSIEWWQTRYSIKSHFPQFIKVKPARAAVGEDFEFAIRRVEAQQPLPTPTRFSTASPFPMETEDGRRSIKADTGTEHTLERYVRIVSVHGRPNLGVNEYYLGVDDRGVYWPRGLAVNAGNLDMQRATCIDGFLQVGMFATYHLEKHVDGTMNHYFTGGVPLTAGRFVRLLEAPKQIDGRMGGRLSDR